jgi:hypothetical protein
MTMKLDKAIIAAAQLSMLAVPIAISQALAVSSLFVAPIALAQDSEAPQAFEPKPDGPIGQRNPRAPSQVAQFEFVAGNWIADVTFISAEGESVPRKAKWHNHWINYGYDLVQEFKSAHAAGSEFRHYDPESGHWVGKNLYAGHVWINTTARMIGDNMVVIVEANNATDGSFLNRETYYDITENQWKMKSDRSFDNGVTWVAGSYEMTANRVINDRSDN